MDTRTIPERRAIEVSSDPSLERKHFKPGARLGRYLLLHLAGRGGMGEVYAAFDPELDRKVAIKFLNNETEPDEARDRLRSEARVMARLAHPNVVTVYDVGSFADRVFVAMEFVDGKTLKDWLSDSPRTWKEILSVFHEAGQGLAAAHAVGILHQDFKPSNIMIGNSGIVRVVDFGLALPIPDSDAPRSGELVGTPGFVAPERLAGQPADTRSDQYSFCIALVHSLAGTTGRVDERYNLPRLPGIPRWLRQALKQGIREDPEDRFPSMERLLESISLSRKRSRRGWFAAAAATLGAMVFGMNYQAGMSRNQQLCTAGADKIEVVWGHEQQAAVKDAFLSTGVSFAENAYHNLTPMADRFVGEWETSYTEACEATHVLGEQSERLLDLRMHCLSVSLEEFRRLMEILAKADAEIVSNAYKAILKLSALETCSNLAELTRLPPLPSDPTARARLEEAELTVAQSRAQRAIRPPVDESALRRALQLARDLDYAPLEAETLDELARIQSDPAAAEELLLGALRAAIASDSRRLEAKIYLELIHQVGILQSRFEDAHLYGRLAEASLSTLGDGDHRLWMEYQRLLGNVSLRKGRRTAARQHYLAAKTIVESTSSLDEPFAAKIYMNLGLVQGPEPEAQERARAYLVRALELNEKAYGTSNPLLGPSLINLAGHHATHGRYDDALELASRCLELQKTYYGEDHRDMVYPLLLVAEVNNANDQARQAKPSLDRALDLVRTGAVKDAYLETLIHLAMSETLLFLGHHEDSELHLDRARSIHADQLSSNSSLLLTLRLQTGLLQLAQGANRQAIDALESALPIETDFYDRRDAWRVLIALGQAHLGLGENEQAVAYLERALSRARPGIDLTLVGETHLALSRAVMAIDQERSRELVMAAQLAVAGRAGEQARDLRSQIHAQLADLGGQRP